MPPLGETALPARAGPASVPLTPVVLAALISVPPSVQMLLPDVRVPGISEKTASLTHPRCTSWRRAARTNGNMRTPRWPPRTMAPRRRPPRTSPRGKPRWNLWGLGSAAGGTGQWREL
eukprot:gene16731-biopygen3809